MSLRAGLVLLATAATIGGAAAQPSFTFEGYADGRLVLPSHQDSWFDGGLGKLRWSQDDRGFKPTEIVGAAHVLATEDISATAVLRIEDYQKTFVDVLEAYVRYRPVSTNAWRWSVKLGAFFPPISLENNEIGWTSEWTLTPSAINSWVGDELRTVGAEAQVEWRSEPRTISAIAALYGYNDPAGVLLAFHGWTLEDRPSGLIDRERLPDALAIGFGATPPIYAQEIIETDKRLGWYAGLDWEETGFASASLLYYDNRADPESFHHGDFGWRTRFWSVGAKTGYDDFVLIAQGMTGDTTVEPFADFYSITDFRAAYVLLGWYISDEWKLAARADAFSTSENHHTLDEHGHAFTIAASWMPKDWLRFTAELIQVVSDRKQRLIEGDPAHANETQFQLSGRVYF